MADTPRGWMKVIADAVDPGNPGVRNDNEPGYLERIASGIGNLAPTAPAPTLAEIKAAILPDVTAAMPQPATVAPPAVTVDSAKGVGTRFALEDHTHQSRLQARFITLTFDANGEAIYTFPLPYDTGVIPIVNVTATNVRGTSYRYDATVIDGSTTNTKTVIALSKTPRTLTVSLLGAVLNVFTNPADTVKINIMSRAPS